jgi:hypothetical protein
MIIVVLIITAAVFLLVEHFHIKNFHVVEPGASIPAASPEEWTIPVCSTNIISPQS